MIENFLKPWNSSQKSSFNNTLIVERDQMIHINSSAHVYSYFFTYETYDMINYHLVLTEIVPFLQFPNRISIFHHRLRHKAYIGVNCLSKGNRILYFFILEYSRRTPFHVHLTLTVWLIGIILLVLEMPR